MVISYWYCFLFGFFWMSRGGRGGRGGRKYFGLSLRQTTENEASKL
ncbi:hypothetical protein NIES267_48480 [Calothrix parasitica NIES-267]|uniref:Uncharacterized protein n=1 Tax=Calothrix parasitica NIES-267 TaxID=1973488 RepID=A0A1Z4LW80_9CYAN|nr:hypothetical protein NIES267_48480 [Calothrix parasitica NIES-267]